MKRKDDIEPTHVSYSNHEEPIVLSKPLMDILLKEDNPADLIALYCFYYYTAKWQQTNQPKATTQYVANGIHWGRDKVIEIKKRLLELDLIKNVITRDEANHITGHYIQLRFIWDNSHPTDFPDSGKSDTNAFNTNNNKRVPPTLEMIKNYCHKINSPIDPEIFYNFYACKGWMVGKNKMKDWHCAVATWEKKDRQENKKGNASFHSNKPKFKYQDNIRYQLCEDGEYRHPKSLALLID